MVGKVAGGQDLLCGGGGHFANRDPFFLLLAFCVFDYLFLAISDILCIQCFSTPRFFTFSTSSFPSFPFSTNNLHFYI